MAGFVKDVIPRAEALDFTARELNFPWDVNSVQASLADAFGYRLSRDIYCGEPYPPYARSLRDGYAVQSPDVSAATTGAPAFLKKSGEVAMGEIPQIPVVSGCAVSIPTGAALPKGADSVVMLEDTAVAGEWIEVRRGVQSGENIVWAGEEISKGQRVLSRGDIVDFRAAGVLSALGITAVPVFAPRISILSTGDEIMPVEVEALPPGAIRDANGYAVKSLLQRYGFASDYRGIVSDDGAVFEKKVHDELAACDVLVLSGGSSVGARDHSSRVLERLATPGLLVRGINIVPGKPTLAAGCLEEKKLVLSLPGHPLSCAAVSFVFLIPLLLAMINAENRGVGMELKLELAKDIHARTGSEEFIPCRVEKDGRVFPLPAKSGYISALAATDGFIRVPENMETLRAGENAEVWTW